MPHAALIRSLWHDSFIFQTVTWESWYMNDLLIHTCNTYSMCQILLGSGNMLFLCFAAEKAVLHQHERGPEGPPGGILPSQWGMTYAAHVNCRIWNRSLQLLYLSQKLLETSLTNYSRASISIYIRLKLLWSYDWLRHFLLFYNP